MAKSKIRDWVESIVVALILALIIRAYFVEPFKIPSGSMRMTLIEGDHIFVSKLRYGPLLLQELHTPEIFQSFLPDIQWPDFIKPLNKIRLPGFGHPKRGDVIVFIYPQDRTKAFIKRLIALPGEKVEISEGHIYINGEEVTDPRIANVFYYNRGDYGQEGVPIIVPEGHYFVLGDNSGSSHDSRFWGFVDEKDVLGRAEIVFWPPGRVRVIK